ncbi:MAG: carbohydrate-binding family 9-like protein, partial [Phycisphaerae bacterium]
MMARMGRLLAMAVGVAALAGAASGQVSSREVAAVWHKLPRPRLAVAPTDKAPEIDGRIGEAEWAAASVVTDFIGTDSPKWRGVAGFDYPAARTTVRVTHDAKGLYLAFRCEEPQIETLQVTGEEKRDSALWRDDCVELFLAPPGAGCHYHFIFNSRGWTYDARNSPGAKRGSDWN